MLSYCTLLRTSQLMLDHSKPLQCFLGHHALVILQFVEKQCCMNSDSFLVHITAAEVFLNNRSLGAQKCVFCFDALLSFSSVLQGSLSRLVEET